MNYTKILSGFLILALISCGHNATKEKLSGVWIMEYRVNNDYISDSADYSFNQSPTIIEFKNNNTLIVNHLVDFDTIYKWSLKSDSNLTFSDLELKITNLTQDNLTVEEITGNRKYTTSFRRPLNTQIALSINEIESMLQSNIWSSSDSVNNTWYKHFEFFDNGAMIFRYNGDTLDNLQLETWVLKEYKNQFFLYNYYDMLLGNGNESRSYQITEIDNNSFSLSAFNPQKGISNYVSKTPINQNKITKTALIGTWISTNSMKNSYGKHLPEIVIQSGGISLYEDELMLVVKDGKMIFSIKNLEPKEYGWQLGIDSKALLLLEQIDNEVIQGFHYECLDILSISDDYLKVKMSDNRFYTGVEKPYCYLLNEIQEFKRIN